jgi:predicted restriction endonuclease
MTVRRESASRAPRGKRWTRDELLLAMHLYWRIPFGRQDQRDPEVAALAQTLGRSASSVAMKLNNFTSLDPEERARGVKGLDGASALDRTVWAEFQAEWEQVAAESELLWTERVENNGRPRPPSRAADSLAELAPYVGPTEAVGARTVRLAQDYFRRAVRAAYEERCCVTGIAVGGFLVASHILPWASHPEERANPANGLCLSRLHDAAFDKALVTFDEDRRLVVGKELREHFTNEAVRTHFEPYEGQRLRSPARFSPDERFLAFHRESLFAG